MRAHLVWLGALAELAVGQGPILHHVGSLAPGQYRDELVVWRGDAQGRRSDTGPLVAALDWRAFGDVAAVRRRAAEPGVVCANVVEVATGAPIAHTHLVVQVGGRRVALVGVTAPVRPAEVADGLRLDAPLATLRDLLPAVGKEADTVVVLANMDRLAAAELLREVGGIAAVIVPARGASDAAALPVGTGLLVQSPDTPAALGVLDLGARRNAFVAPPPSDASAPAAKLEIVDVDAARWVGKPPPAAPPGRGAATTMTRGGLQVVSSEGQNRALELRAHSFRVVDEYARHAAPPGRAYLLADVEWTNAIPTQYAFGHEVPVAFQIDDFREILFAVVDGARLGRFDADLSALPGGLIETPFLLPDLGSRRRAVAVFEIPAGDCRTLDLRFYDFTHGHVALPLLVGDAGPASAVQAQNELLAAEVHAVQRGGTRPDGQELLRVDLRARSVWSIDVDATAFDPAAKPGARMSTPTLGRWEDVQANAHLVIDGVEDAARTPLAPADTLLLPDVAVGGGLTFEVPRSAKTFDLRLVFPPMAVPGRQEPLQPSELRLALTPSVVAAEVPAAESDGSAGDMPAPNAPPPAAPLPNAPPPNAPLPNAPLPNAPPTTPPNAPPPVVRPPSERLVLPAAPATGESEAAPPEAVAPPSPAQLAAAVHRGGAFLWSDLQAKDPRAVGAQILFGHDEELLEALALAHSGALAETPAAEAWVRELLRALQPRSGMDVYQVGVAAMLIDQLGDGEFLATLQALARYLVEGQHEDGSWDYGAMLAPELLTDLDRRPLRVSGGLPLDGSPPATTPCERRSPFQATRGGDNSTTQFALLGLHAAAANGIGIPAATWRRANACMRARQNPDGGFSYTGERGSPSTGSMTAAGLAVLLLSERDPAKAPLQPAVARAEQWLDRHLRIESNPGEDAHAPYWRYGVERVGRLLGRPHIGKHEWYELGARHLLATQQDDGSWQDQPPQPLQDTGFALLFLTRATRPLQTELARGGVGTLSTGLTGAVPGRVYVILDASGSMLDQLGGEVKFVAATRAVQQLVEQLPAGTQFALRAYGHRHRANEPGAGEDSELLLPFGPVDAASVRRALAGLRARGRTPLSYSMALARDDVADAPSATTVVLLTDGGEDPQSRRDPRKEAAELQRAGVALCVVGFDIGRGDWTEQLRATAECGGGSYFAAADGAELRARVLTAALALPGGFRVLGTDGREVAQGKFGDRVALPEGAYVLTTEFGGREFRTSFWVNTAATTRIVFDGVNARR